MNGTHAGGVHGAVETIVTSYGVKQPIAFEAFFGAERVRLFRALYLLTGNTEEAEEVLQEAFIAIWERWDRVGAMADPTGYLYRTAMNRWRRATRSARRSGSARVKMLSCGREVSGSVAKQPGKYC